MPFIVDDADLDVDQLRRIKLQSALRKFAVAVAGRSLDLNIVVHNHLRPYGEPPAWSDGSTINLWHDVQEPIMEVDSLVRLKGLAIHELGHVLFTPRDRTQLVKDVQARGVWQSFNILEDNRIDNMMVARLSGVAPWLLHTVLKEFFATGEGHEYLLPLLHGRKYVPQNIRDLAAQVYHDPDSVTAIQRIIDEYITLNLARKDKHARALELVTELAQLINPQNTNTSHTDIASPSKNGGEDMAGIREQDDALQRAEKQQQQQQQQQQSTSETQAPATPTEAKQQLDEQLQQAKSRTSNQIYEDIKDLVKGMRTGNSTSGSGESDSTVKNAQHVNMRAVAPEMALNTRQFTRVLQELKALYDPGWVTNQAEGRLNARQFLMGADLDQSFDLWDDGRQDASDIECVIILDISGSMYHQLDQAYDAMWGIKRALDSINAKTTVLTFGDYSRVLYSPESRATIHKRYSMDGYGSTNPLHAVKYARNTLLNSSSAIKLFIAITDGYWYDAEQCDPMIAEMGMSGVLTGLVHLVGEWDMQRAEDGDYHINSHKCQVVRTMRNPHDITELARELVRRQQQLVLQS